MGPSTIPDISVVVPTRNREALLRRLLRQLLHLDAGPTYEIVVVDEGSSDGTPALLDRMAADHGVVVIRHAQPRGLPGARNAGAAAARAAYIAWIDDDDLTAPDRLRRQYEALRASGRHWSCAGRVNIDDDLAIIGHARCPSEDDLLPTILRFNTIPSAAQGLLVERSLFEEVGGYDESFDSAEDWELCIRLAEVADPHFLDEPLVGYRTGMASMSTDTGRMERAIAAVLAKHRPLQIAHRVDPDWEAIHRSLLSADLLHSRGHAARRATKVFRARRSARNAAMIVAVLVRPGWVARQMARRRAAQVPQQWLEQARLWLDQVDPAEVTPPG